MPESDMTAFLRAFGKLDSKRPPAVKESESRLEKNQFLSSGSVSAPQNPAQPPIDSTAAFLQAFGDLAGSSPLEIPKVSRPDGSGALSEPNASESTSPQTLEPITPLPTTLADPMNAAFLRAFEDAVGASPLKISSSSLLMGKESSAAAPVDATVPSTQLPPPEQVVDDLLARLDDVIELDNMS